MPLLLKYQLHAFSVYLLIFQISYSRIFSHSFFLLTNTMADAAKTAAAVAAGDLASVAQAASAAVAGATAAAVEDPARGHDKGGREA